MGTRCDKAQRGSRTGSQEAAPLPAERVLVRTGVARAELMKRGQVGDMFGWQGVRRDWRWGEGRRAASQLGLGGRGDGNCGSDWRQSRCGEEGHPGAPLADILFDPHLHGDIM